MTNGILEITPIRLPSILSTLPPEVRALRSAVGHLLGRWPKPDETQALIERGWTVEKVESVDALLQFAWESETFMVYPAFTAGEGYSSARSDIQRITEACVKAGRSPDFLLGWLRVMVAAPDETTLQAIRGPLTNAGHGLMKWWHLAGPERGPLAYVAGLSKREVKDMKQARECTVEALEVLLALRGWVLPPVR